MTLLGVLIAICVFAVLLLLVLCAVFEFRQSLRTWRIQHGKPGYLPDEATRAFMEDRRL